MFKKSFILTSVVSISYYLKIIKSICFTQNDNGLGLWTYNPKFDDQIHSMILSSFFWARCFDVSKSKWNAWRSLLLVVCVCLYVFEFVNPLSVMIQGCLISIFLKKDVFSKESENPTCWNVDSTGCFTLSVFWKGFEKAWLYLTLMSNQFNRLIHVFNRLILWKS